MTKSTLDIFINEAPEVQKAYANFIQTLISDDGLDIKTKQLIYIGMKMIVDDEKLSSCMCRWQKMLELPEKR
ncbi:MAG: carboxymuconolactone decarboxylase family protein [Saprospiraceae bacterium]